MKNFFLSLVLLFPMFCFGQFGVCFQQSNSSVVGVNYEFFNRLRTELRFGLDMRTSERASLELAVIYDYFQKEEYELYAGLGVINRPGSLIVPIGINLYPFENKRFGFNIEVAPVFGRFAGSSEIKGRVSGGFRYRFTKD